MKHTVSGAGVVRRAGKVLLVEQQGGSWSLPKGHLEKGETAAQAAAREVREESGVFLLRLVSELGTYERHRIGLDMEDDLSELKEIRVFLFDTDQARLAPEDPKILSARWVTPEEAADLLTHPRDAAFFRSRLPEIREE